MAGAFAEAPVYTALYDPSLRDIVAPERVTTSWLQSLPGSGRAFRYLAPFYPGVFEGFDFRGYDLVVSSTTSFAKGILVPRETTHVCLIHTVSRFVFNYDGYVGGFGARTLAAPLVKRLVDWDLRAAQRPTALIANSKNVAARIKRYYGRDAHVLYCPIDVDRFVPGTGDGGYYLVVSRLLPYKRIDIAIDACAQIGARLIVAGTGPSQDALVERARGTKTDFTGYISDAEVASLMAGAIAVIVPGEEDLGLVPLEANAAGRPAIALAAGGALETVVPGMNGEHFAYPHAASLAAVLRIFDPSRFDPAALRTHAQTFAPDRFLAQLRTLIDEIVTAHRA